ncbi:Sperm-tail_PG-rich repeat [Hexamita inflata]|uniref:Sperm-tail PG-rich repeat n=1 Tax=Hexamita inflata TaxID=28002 RepID=A0AA86QIG0_9EUKA|nr:Sperm-tail PG-rich repeat [Hexamita inflata]
MTSMLQFASERQPFKQSKDDRNKAGPGEYTPKLGTIVEKKPYKFFDKKQIANQAIEQFMPGDQTTVSRVNIEQTNPEALSYYPKDQSIKIAVSCPKTERYAYKTLNWLQTEQKEEGTYFVSKKQFKKQTICAISRGLLKQRRKQNQFSDIIEQNKIHPTPTTYDKQYTQVLKSLPELSFSKLQRFQTVKSEIPGPGSYKLKQISKPKYVGSNVLRKDREITLPNFGLSKTPGPGSYTNVKTDRFGSKSYW